MQGLQLAIIVITSFLLGVNSHALLIKEDKKENHEHQQ